MILESRRRNCHWNFWLFVCSPTSRQVTPHVFDLSGKFESILPTCIASGDGSSIIMTKAKNDEIIDDALRAACMTARPPSLTSPRPLED